MVDVQFISFCRAFATVDACVLIPLKYRLALLWSEWLQFRLKHKIGIVHIDAITHFAQIPILMQLSGGAPWIAWNPPMNLFILSHDFVYPVVVIQFDEWSVLEICKDQT